MSTKARPIVVGGRLYATVAGVANVIPFFVILAKTLAPLANSSGIRIPQPPSLKSVVIPSTSAPEAKCSIVTLATNGYLARLVLPGSSESNGTSVARDGFQRSVSHVHYVVGPHGGSGTHHFGWYPNQPPAGDAASIFGNKGSRWGWSYAPVQFSRWSMQEGVLESLNTFGT